MGKTITQRSKHRKQNRSHRLNCDQSLTLSKKSYIIIKSDVFLDWEEISFGIVRKNRSDLRYSSFEWFVRGLFAQHK